MYKTLLLLGSIAAWPVFGETPKTFESNHSFLQTKISQNRDFPSKYQREANDAHYGLSNILQANCSNGFEYMAIYNPSEKLTEDITTISNKLTSGFNPKKMMTALENNKEVYQSHCHTPTFEAFLEKFSNDYEKFENLKKLGKEEVEQRILYEIPSGGYLRGDIDSMLEILVESYKLHTDGNVYNSIVVVKEGFPVKVIEYGFTNKVEEKIRGLVQTYLGVRKLREAVFASTSDNNREDYEKRFLVQEEESSAINDYLTLKSDITSEYQEFVDWISNEYCDLWEVEPCKNISIPEIVEKLNSGGTFFINEIKMK